MEGVIEIYDGNLLSALAEGLGTRVHGGMSVVALPDGRFVRLPRWYRGGSGGIRWPEYRSALLEIRAFAEGRGMHTVVSIIDPLVSTCDSMTAT